MKRLTTVLMVGLVTLLGVVSCKTKEKQGGILGVYGPGAVIGDNMRPAPGQGTQQTQQQSSPTPAPDGTTGASQQQRK